jgi:hypothetical protein
MSHGIAAGTAMLRINPQVSPFATFGDLVFTDGISQDIVLRGCRLDRVRETRGPVVPAAKGGDGGVAAPRGRRRGILGLRHPLRGCLLVVVAARPLGLRRLDRLDRRFGRRLGRCLGRRFGHLDRFGSVHSFNLHPTIINCNCKSARPRSFP